MNITKVKDGVVLTAAPGYALPSNGGHSLHLSTQGWEALRAVSPEGIALRELVEALLAEGDEEYCAMVNRALGHKPELASAVQEGRVLVRRMKGHL